MVGDCRGATECPFDTELRKLGIAHVLIPPKPWQNGKAELSHRSDQRYFYDWEEFRSVADLNEKMEKHLERSNNKPMLSLKYKSPKQMLAEKMSEKSEG